MNVQQGPTITQNAMGTGSDELQNKKNKTASTDDSTTTDPSGNSIESKKPTSSQLTRDKKKQVNLTLQWLDENYCTCEGVCLPRNVLYTHYLDFCTNHNIQPACAATFGKTIRHKFPNLTTRRLGTRGHSKYHYYGIGIKESSQYYHTVYSSQGITRFSGCKHQCEGGFTRKYSLSAKLGTLLPDFPSASYLLLPSCVSQEKVETFFMMYRTHCQCILDTTINGTFQEIETYLSHFWQGLPSHMTHLLKVKAIEDTICICDSILYKTMVDVLIPATMQEMSDELLCEIRSLGHHWVSWLTSSMEGLPSRLCHKKYNVAKQFAQFLKRQVSFIHLAQTARPVLYDAKLVNQMIEDTELVDSVSMAPQCLSLYLQEERTENSLDADMAVEVLKEFKEILRKQATVESFIEWLDGIIEKKILQVQTEGASVQKLAQDFMLKWSFFGSRISHCLTLNNAKSFGSIHLIRLLLDEYTLLAIESQLYCEKERALQDEMKQHIHIDDKVPDLCGSPRLCFIANRKAQPLPDSLKKEGQSSTEKLNSESSLLTPPMSPAQGTRTWPYEEISTPYMHQGMMVAKGKDPCPASNNHMYRVSPYPYISQRSRSSYEDNLYKLYSPYELGGSTYGHMNNTETNLTGVPQYYNYDRPYENRLHDQYETSSPYNTGSMTSQSWHQPYGEADTITDPRVNSYHLNGQWNPHNTGQTGQRSRSCYGPYTYHTGTPGNNMGSYIGNTSSVGMSYYSETPYYNDVTLGHPYINTGYA